MKELIPLDTFYDSRYFRSRTEARWAVFFNSLGWAYDYELEGYELKSGFYLPDLYFKDINVWAEVKPFELTDSELQKCKDLSLKMNSNECGIDVMLLEGTPGYKTIRTISNGQFSFNVIPVDPTHRSYPFYTSDKFDYKNTSLSQTRSAIIDALSIRFEFEWKERKNG